MSEWWTYRLSDFLLFSPETYYRLFELYHRELWPVQFVATSFALAIAVLLIRPARHSRRIVLAILAIAWLWTGWAFHLERYATINWAARHFGTAFLVQSALLTLALFLRETPHPERTAAPRIGLGVVIYGVFLHPLVGMLGDRSAAELELFGLTPDATALVTVGAILASGVEFRVLLLILPLLWCLIGGATLRTLGAPDAWPLLSMPVLALVTLFLNHRNVKERAR